MASLPSTDASDTRSPMGSYGPNGGTACTTTQTPSRILSFSCPFSKPLPSEWYSGRNGFPSVENAASRTQMHASGFTLLSYAGGVWCKTWCLWMWWLGMPLTTARIKAVPIGQGSSRRQTWIQNLIINDETNSINGLQMKTITFSHCYFQNPWLFSYRFKSFVTW